MLQPANVRRVDAAQAQLRRYAVELHDDLRLVPLLRKLMNVSCQLTAATGGSISIVDAPHERYLKIAEHRTACRLGQSFPLDEGVTGRVIHSRRPVVLARYRDITSGHLPPGHPARDGAVAAIPIWWRAEIVGVNVVFAGRPTQFSTSEVDELEALTQLVAPGLVLAVEGELALTHLRSGPPPGAPDRAPEPLTSPAGSTDPATTSVATVARGLIRVAEQAGVRRRASRDWLDVSIAPDGDGLRLLVTSEAYRQQATDGAPSQQPARWVELVDRDGGVGPEALTTSDGYPPVGDRAPARAGAVEPSPFTRREQQVVSLLARGLSDRAVAEQLVISPKTVEKHVGAVLRKTGTTSRTAAVVCALAAHWVDDDALAS